MTIILPGKLPGKPHGKYPGKSPGKSLGKPSHENHTHYTTADGVCPLFFPCPNISDGIKDI